MKVKNYLYIILNIIFTIIEYYIIYLIINKTMINSKIISLIITFCILLICILLSLLIYKKDIFKDVLETNKTKTEKYSKILDPFVKEINDKYHLNCILRYVDLDIKPNPAWCFENYIYINIAYASADEELLGVCAHEIGHIYSGLNKRLFYFMFRLSTILSMIVSLGIRVICPLIKKNKILNILLYLIYSILLTAYILLNYINLLIVFPFLRQDEVTANSFSVNVNKGKELIYYYLSIDNEKPNTSLKLLKIIDFEHPKVSKMINIMKKEINDELLNQGYLIYSDTLKLCLSKDTNIILNDILHIDRYAFMYKNDTKTITMNNVKILSNTTLRYLKKLQGLEMKKLEHFTDDLFILCPDLKEVIIDNDQGLYQLGLSYLKIKKNEESIKCFENTTKHIPSLKMLVKMYNEEEKILDIHIQLATLGEIKSIIWLINYYESKEDYLISNNYIDILCLKGHSYGFYKKGEYYYRGIVVEKNEEIAVKYLELSKEKEAISILKEIKGEIYESINNTN